MQLFMKTIFSLQELQEIQDLHIPNTESDWDVYLDGNGEVHEKAPLGYFTQSGDFIPLTSVLGNSHIDFVSDKNSLFYSEPFCKYMTLNFLKAKKGGYGNVIRHRYGAQKMELTPIYTPEIVGLQRSDQRTVIVVPWEELTWGQLVIGGVYQKLSEWYLGRQIKSSQALTQIFLNEPSVASLDILIEREKEIIRRSMAIALKKNVLGMTGRHLVSQDVRKQIYALLSWEGLTWDILWNENQKYDRCDAEST